MESGFRDPIAPPKGAKKKSPWDFTQPEYDERSSCYINAGTHYGVGHNQPVGHGGNPRSSEVIPQSRVKGMKVDETPRRNDPIEFLK